MRRHSLLRQAAHGMVREERDRVRALAPRRVAVGRLRTAPALLTEQTPGTTRAPVVDAFASMVWVCSPVEGRLARYILVWDVISLSVANPALYEASESPGPVGPAPGQWPGPKWAATGRVRVI